MPLILPKSLILTTIFSFIYLTDSSGFVKNVTSGNIPDWVVKKSPDTDTRDISVDSYGGYYYLLVDIQENIPLETTFYHFVVKVLNNEGLQNMSDISADFDPAFQSLTIHEINRYRNGIKTDEISRHEIKTIQREADMTRFLYDGRLTAIVNLEDSRDGDIIEYSYSVRGYNPVYNGNFFKTLSFEYNDPVREIYKRIVSLSGIKLNFHYPSGRLEPETGHSGDLVSYTWNRKNVKALIYDNNVPSWYNANLRVQVTTLDSWNEINKMCLPNYMLTEYESAGFKIQSSKIHFAEHADSILISLVRFVQDEIRYLGFESGTDALKPVKPDKVLELRYADCKAKSLLLCSLLKLRGIEAHPVLVSTDMIRFENQYLPSPGIFNHVIVQVTYKGACLYFDPTLSNQGGTPENHFFPDYGYGLVLKDGTAGLTALTNKCTSETKVNNYFRVDTIGHSVYFKVVTDYSGHYANDQRSYFRNNSSEAIQKNYLKFYSGTYPSIRSIAPLVYKDDRINNLFTVDEEYRIDSMWTPSENNRKRLEMTVAALVINNAADLPASPQRKMPYAIPYPSKYTEEIIIDLPEEWSITPKNTTIVDSVFSFSYSSMYSDNRIKLNYKYNTLSDHQPDSTFTEFFKNHEKVSDNLQYQISYTHPAIDSFRFSWTALFFFIVLFIICSHAATRIYFSYNRKVLVAKADEYEEIGGWLIIIAIGLIISTIKVSWSLFVSNNYFNEVTWSAFQSHDNKYMILSLLCVEFIYNSALIVYIIFLQFLFYKRRNALPNLMIVFYIVNTIFFTTDTLLAFSLLPDNYTPGEKNRLYLTIIQSFITSAIWVSYFLFSKRVKGTFIKEPESFVPGTFSGKILYSLMNRKNRTET